MSHVGVELMISIEGQLIYCTDLIEKLGRGWSKFSSLIADKFLQKSSTSTPLLIEME